MSDDVTTQPYAQRELPNASRPSTLRPRHRPAKFDHDQFANVVILSATVSRAGPMPVSLGPLGAKQRMTSLTIWSS